MVHIEVPVAVICQYTRTAEDEPLLSAGQIEHVDRPMSDDQTADREVVVDVSLECYRATIRAQLRVEVAERIHPFDGGGELRIRQPSLTASITIHDPEARGAVGRNAVEHDLIAHPVRISFDRVKRLRKIS
jgi:hypothetical protein